MKTKKKGLHPNWVQFLAKKQLLAHRFCAQTFCPSYKRGAMPQFCILFYAKHIILATQRGGALAQWPPPKYAPAIAPAPPIIVRFGSRDIRNKIYGNEQLLCKIDLTKFLWMEPKTCIIMKTLLVPVNDFSGKLTRRLKLMVWSTTVLRMAVCMSKKDENINSTTILIRNEPDLDQLSQC